MKTEDGQLRERCRLPCRHENRDKFVCHGFLCAKLLLFLLCSWSNAVAQSDSAAPMLIGYTFSPTSVDTTAGPVSMTGSIQASDNLSGVSSGSIVFRSPSGNYRACNSSAAPIAGTIVNGTWSCSGNIPQYAEAGAWQVDSVYISDNAGNTRTWNTADLQLLGLPTTLTVTGTTDRTAPVLIGYTFSPTSVDTTAGPVSMTGSIQASDNLSGVSSGSIVFRSPSGNYRACNSSAAPIAGTIVNGTWSCSGNIPQYAEAGAWQVDSVYISDNAGNTRTWNTADLQLLGLPTTLTVSIGAPPVPSVKSLLPLTGASSSGTFIATYEHTGGASQHYLSYLLILPTPNVVNYVATGSCLVEYNRISNGVRLIDDAGTGWLGGQSGIPISASAGTLENKQCLVEVSKVVVTRNTNVLSVIVPVVFKSGLAGVLGTFLQALDVNGVWTGMTQFGNWVAPGINSRLGPRIDGMFPLNGSGNSALLHMVVRHPNGATASLAMLHMLISDRIVGGSPCQVVYFPASNMGNLINDTGTDLAGGWISPGAGLVSNSRCSLSGIGMSRTIINEGQTIVLTLPLSFNTGSFSGLKNIYLNAFDNTGYLSHWVQTGIWTVE